LIERLEHPGLQRLVLDDGLDDHPSVSHIGEIGCKAEACNRSVALDFSHAVARNGPIERADEAVASALGTGGIDFVDDGVEASPYTNFGDASAHLAAAHDAHTLNIRSSLNHCHHRSDDMNEATAWTRYQ
jgi:hypothetical protein